MNGEIQLRNKKARDFARFFIAWGKKEAFRVRFAIIKTVIPAQAKRVRGIRARDSCR